MPVVVTTASAETQVNTYTAGNQLDPVIARLADGGWIVTWTSDGQDGSGGGIFQQRYDSSGAPVGAETQVNATTTDLQSGAHVTGLTGGGWVVTWHSYTQDGSLYGVYQQQYDSTGAVVGGETLVNTYTAGSQYYPAVTALADGGWLMTWMSDGQDGSDAGIFMQRYDSAGARVSGEVLVNTTISGFQAYSSVVTLADGGWVVSWSSNNQDGSGFGIYQQRFDNAGAAVGLETRVNTYFLGAQQQSTMSALEDGGWIVTWFSQNQDTSGYGVYQQRYDSVGVAIGGEERVNSTTAGDQLYGSVTGLADGGWVVTWHSPDGSQYGIFQQRFDSNGGRIGGELRVSVTVTDSQSQSWVTATDDGGWVVTWQSENQDGSSAGIFQRIFTPEGASVLTAQSEIAQGSEGDDVFVVEPGALGAGDTVEGGAGYDIMVLNSAGTLDLTAPAIFSGIEMIEGSDGDDVMIASGDRLADVTRFEGLAGEDELRLVDDADLSAIQLAGIETITVASGADVTLTLTAEQVALVDGSAGGEVRVQLASGETLTAEERQAAYDNGVDAVRIGDVTYTSDGRALATTGESLVNTYTTGIQQSIALAALADGGWIATWASNLQDGSSLGVYQQRYDNTGAAVGVETLVNTYITSIQNLPSVTGLADGGWVVTWQSSGQDTSGYGVYQQRYSDTGALVGVETLVNTTVSLAQQASSVVALADGGWVVTWESGSGQDGSLFGVYQQRFDSDGVAQGGEIRVNTYTPDSQSAPSVTALDGGGWVVTWQSNNQDGSGAGIYQQRYDSAGATVDGETLVSPAPYSQVNPSATGLADGGWIVTWQSGNQDGGGLGVYQQRYDSAGAAVGVETRVNTYTTSDQANPAVAAMADGGWVVTWSSSGQDGSSLGVYHQRYDSAGAPVGPETLSTETTFGAANFPSITGLANGGFVIGWTMADANSTGVFQRLFDAAQDYHTLTAGADDITGTAGDTTVVLSPANLDAADTLTGGLGADVIEMSASGVVDLTAPATLSGFETILGASGDDTLIVSTARLADVDAIDLRGGSDDAIVTADATLDLTGIILTNVERIGSTNAAGTAFTAGSVADALLVDGSAGAADSVTIAGSTFTEAERDQLFDQGVESVTDDSGTYNAAVAPEPPTLSLDSGSDSGVANDGVTNDTTPTVTGTTEAGATVTIYDTDGVTILGSDVADGSGAYSITLSELTEGTRTLTATAQNGSGLVSAASTPLSLTIDTSAPTAPTIDLDAASDTGPLDDDDSTSDTTPSFSGTAAAGAIVAILRDGVEVDTVTADGNGDWTWTSSELADGDYVFTARVSDLAGNAAEAGLAVSLDTTPPAPSIDLDAGSDSGSDDGDDITNDTTPTLTGTGPVNSVIRIYEDDVLVASGMSGADGSWSITLPEQSEGAHTYRAVAVNALGHESLPSTGPARAVGAEFRVNTYTSNDQTNQQITALNNGGFVVTWQSFGQDGSGLGVYGQAYDAAGVAWGAEFRVNTFGPNDQTNQQVTALDDGSFVVTWQSYGQVSSTWDVFAKVFTPQGVAVTGEILVNTTLVNHQQNPQITALEGGAFVVAWTSEGQDGSGSGVVARRFEPGVSTGAEFRVNSYPTSDQNNQQVTALEGGGFVVTWQSTGQYGSGFGVFGQLYDAAGVASGFEFRVSSSPNNYQSTQQVTALEGGGFVVSWTSSLDGRGSGVSARIYNSAGVAASNEFQVNTFGTSNQFGQQITALEGGGFVITWTSFGQDAASTNGVYAQVYDAAGAPFGAEFRVNSYTAASQEGSQITALEGGGFVITWVSHGQDAANTTGVYAQVYDSLGAPSGAEFRVNAYVTDNQTAPQVTAVAGGGFVVTWSSYGQDGSLTGVYAQRYVVPINTFEPVGDEFRVNTETLGHQLEQQTTPLEGGGFVVTWSSSGQDAADSYGVYAQVYDAAGAPLGGEFRVNTNTAGDQTGPRITALEGGGFVVAWSSEGQDSSSYGVYAQVYNASGAPSGDELQVNTYTAGEQISPQIAALEGGGFVVTWSSSGQDGSNYGVYAQVFDAAGAALGDEFRANTYTTNDQFAPQIAPLEGGGFVIAWQSSGQDGSSIGVYAQVYDASGAPSGEEFRVNTYVGSTQDTPQITALEGGGFVVAWVSFGQDGQGPGVYAQVYDAAGAPSGGELRVNTYTTNSQAFQKITALEGGGFVVTWQSAGQDGSLGGIYAQIYTVAGARSGGEFRVNAYTGNEQTSQQITALEGGGFVITWQSDFQDGSATGVYAQVYDATGALASGELLVNSHTTGQQSFPQVSALEGGGFVISWVDIGQDGSGYGVYARRFEAPQLTLDVTIDTTAPTAGGSSPTLAEGGTVDLDGYLSYTDANGGDLTYTLGTVTAGELRLDGVALGAGETFTQADVDAGRIVFVHDGSETTSGNVTFTVTDQAGNTTAEQSFDLTVTPANDSPEVVNDSVTLAEGGSVVFTAAEFQASDAEQGAIDLTFTITSLPSNGVLTRNGTPLGQGDTFVQAEIDTGQIGYSHDGSETTSDSFGFSVSDGAGGSVTNQTFSLTVTAVDDAAVAQDDALATAETAIISGDVFADNGSGADGDVDGPALEVSEVNGEAADVGEQVTLASGALLTLNADGTYTYDPNGAFNLAGPGSGASNTTATDSFTYTLASGATATVTVTVSGEDGHDRVEGTAGADDLFGGVGNDILIGGVGPDDLDGGDGIDTVSYEGATDRVVARLSTGLGSQGEANGDTFTAVENLTGGSANDSLIGSAAANILRGGDGDDYLDGLAGDDTLYGGAGDDRLVGSFGADVLNGGDGVDTAWYDHATTRVVVSLWAGTGSQGVAAGDTLISIENITGGSGGDALIGSAAANVLAGGDGDDYLDGLAGNDTLQGGRGADLLHGGAGADGLYGGDGNDTASYLHSTARVVASLETMTGSEGDAAGDTFSSIENLTGGAGDDALTGSSGANILIGGAGADVIDGLAGDDTLEGGAGADVLNGGDGIDTASYAGSAARVVARLWNGIGSQGDANGDSLISIENITGGSANDSLIGSDVANVLRGGSGADYLNGLAGDDTIEGGVGADVMLGGSGNDVFVFTGSGWGDDVINDFMGGAAVGDVIRFTTDLYADFAAVMAAAVDTAGGVVIGVQGNSVRLEGVTKAQLNANDFQFTGPPAGAIVLPDETTSDGPLILPFLVDDAPLVLPGLTDEAKPIDDLMDPLILPADPGPKVGPADDMPVVCPPFLDGSTGYREGDTWELAMSDGSSGRGLHRLLAETRGLDWII